MEFFKIMDFFKILEKIYNFITLRYLTILKIKSELPDDSVYKDIVQDELDFYHFYTLAGYYERNPNERKKYLTFYNKNKSKINMLFEEFVSMRPYMEIDNTNNTVQIDLKKSNIHIFGKFFFILVFILLLVWVCLFILLDSITILIFTLVSIGAIIFLFMFNSSIESFERAKRYKKQQDKYQDSGTGY